MANDLTQPVYVESQNSVRAFIIRYSFLVYVVLTLILGWYPWYLGIRPTQMFFVPFLTALILAPVVGGRKGLSNFLRRMVVALGIIIDRRPKERSRKMESQSIEKIDMLH